ncbi:TPA: hypothetical protein ACX6RO_003428 [Photobacterium damselae]
MRNLHLILCPLSSKQKNNIREDNNSDIFIMDGIEVDPDIKKRSKFLSSVPYDSFQDIKNVYRQLFENEEFELDYFIVYSELLNINFFKPLFTVVNFINKNSMNYKQINIYSTNYHDDSIPLILIKNIESRFGSEYLTGAIISNILQKSLKLENVKFNLDKYSILSFKFFRRAVVLFFDYIFVLNFFRKIINLKYSYSSYSKINEASNLFIVRTSQHILESKKLALENSNQKFHMIIVPQFRQGGIKDILEQIQVLPTNLGVDIITAKMLLSVIFMHKKKIRRRFEKKEILFNVLNNIERINTDKVYDEISNFYSDKIYMALLNKYIKQNQLYINKVYNYALRGRYSAFDYYSCREYDKRLYTFQIASVSSSPSPMFPLCDKFFTNTANVVDSIKNDGVINHGKIIYQGGLFEITETTCKDNYGLITFYTQPYEYDINIKIILTLISFALNNNKKIAVKLHPRDSGEYYRDIIYKNSEIIYIISGTNATDSLINTDICIARTSSVIIEALSTGVPVIVCLFSDFDYNFDTDYINILISKNLYCSNDSDLMKSLNNISLVVDYNNKVKDVIYEGKDIKTLSLYIGN